jgi:hypothetical protein
MGNAVLLKARLSSGISLSILFRLAIDEVTAGMEPKTDCDPVRCCVTSVMDTNSIELDP